MERFPHSKISAARIAERLESARPPDVEAALSTPRPTVQDLPALVSSAAEPYLEPMRKRARESRLRQFGRIVGIYAPLYVSNVCVNSCDYCAFKGSHEGPRRRLSVDEAVEEASVIRDMGVDSLLLVSGEDPLFVDIPYLAALAGRLRNLFSYLAVEIQPLALDGYKALFNAGVHGLTLYQETYQADFYAKYHRSGPKADFNARLDAVEAGARAGFHNVGIGPLLGLADWRVEAVFLAVHAAYLQKHHWRTRIQLSFPRITPIPGGFQTPFPVSERNLEQMMLAFRIVFPECDLNLSTRERSEFRDRMAVDCANRLSAGSKVAPGAYGDSEAGDVGQFEVTDTRSVAEVADALRSLGLEPVFKDWDGALRS